MDGVLVVNKPQGLTSHDVVAVARRSLHERRIGHTGTLDPLATGVLPLACGQATRLVRFFVSSDKEYEATVRFGVATDSYDITGAQTANSGLVPTAAAIEAALEPLRGDYEQVPPAFSAKKIGGERAYAKARRDEAVTLSAVPVSVGRASPSHARPGFMSGVLRTAWVSWWGLAPASSLYAGRAAASSRSTRRSDSSTYSAWVRPSRRDGCRWSVSCPACRQSASMRKAENVSRTAGCWNDRTSSQGRNRCREARAHGCGCSIRTVNSLRWRTLPLLVIFCIRPLY
jgi:tRNA pseudouridine(55) synthase